MVYEKYQFPHPFKLVSYSLSSNLKITKIEKVWNNDCKDHTANRYITQRIILWNLYLLPTRKNYLWNSFNYVYGIRYYYSAVRIVIKYKKGKRVSTTTIFREVNN